MALKNYTPHEIVLLNSDDSVYKVLPSLGEIRVGVKAVQNKEFTVLTGGFPATSSLYSELEFPEDFDSKSEEGDVLIVSALTKNRAKEIGHPLSDIMCNPGKCKRNDKGQVVGCYTLDH